MFSYHTLQYIYRTLQFIVFLTLRNLNKTSHRIVTNTSYTNALQPVCTVHPGVHQNMRGVHHYERVRKGASQTCHTKQILLTKLSVSKIDPFNQPMTSRI